MPNKHAQQTCHKQLQMWRLCGHILQMPLSPVLPSLSSTCAWGWCSTGPAGPLNTNPEASWPHEATLEPFHVLVVPRASGRLCYILLLWGALGSCPQGLPEQIPAPRPLHLPKPCTLCSPTFPKLPLSRVPKLLSRLLGAACEYQTAGKMLKSSARYGGCWMATPKPASLCERSNRAPP